MLDPLNRDQRRSRPLHEAERATTSFFVTICGAQRIGPFGSNTSGLMRPNATGRMVQSEWMILSQRFPMIQPDVYVLRPDHFHAIVTIDLAASPRASSHALLREIVTTFTAVTDAAYLRGVADASWPPLEQALWQPAFYTYAIQNDVALAHIRAYVACNPSQSAAQTFHEVTHQAICMSQPSASTD